MSAEIQRSISGEAVTIRPIRITDAAMEAEFIRRLSAQTKHYRFLGGVKELYSIDLADNAAMRALAADLGMKAHSDPADPTQVVYSLSLQ